MKRFTALLTMLVLLVSVATFAGDHGKKMTAEEKSAWMAKELSLSADQQAKLTPIIAEQQQKIEAVWKDSSLSEDQKMAKKSEIKESTSTQIKALLNADQQEKFAALSQPKAKETATK
jgi:protein CpxP